jgi:chromosome segregation ATPase
VDQNLAEAAHVTQGDTKAIDLWLKGLWDRAKKAAEVISRLREEKAELQARVNTLEEELSRLRSDLDRSEEQLRSVSSDHQITDQTFLSNGEREQLSVKVKDLLAKLDAYI